MTTTGTGTGRPPVAAAVAAYRIQQWTEGGFAGARARLPHLTRLGVSHLYTSPVTAAAPGSTHGYDGVDPTTVAPQLGGADELDRLLESLADAGIGWLLDIVPNHLGVAVPSANPRWWSVLRHGPEAPEARFFDIDWDAAGGRVVLPVLGRPLHELVAEGEVRLEELHGEPVVSAGGFVVPLRPDGPRPHPGPAPSGAELADLLDAQHYRLDWWRAGTRNYRIFFDVTTLAGLRIEDPEVFDEVHRLPAMWLESGRLEGIRVDHVDGLADPDGYLRRLRALVGPDGWLVVEKIVLGEETLPSRWPVDGTTGYEVAAWITRLLVDPDRETEHTARYQARTGATKPWPQVEQEAKDQALATRMAVDVRVLADTLADSPAEAPTGPADAGRMADGPLTEAVAAVSASLPVYRTYLPYGGPADRELVAAAVAAALSRRPELAEQIDRVARALSETDTGTTHAGESSDVLLRWQQLTGPAMAKGVEDTALYRYRRLGALNDVGTDPEPFGTSAAAFHRAMAVQLATAGGGLVTTTTHDTKRSADVRARLAALPGVGQPWDHLVDRLWPVLVDGPDPVPPLTAHLLLETAVGAWPIDADRLAGFLLKAEREAGLATTWQDPSDPFEQAVAAAVRRLRDDPEVVALLDRFVADHLDRPGRVNALTQVLLRCTLPGVPDVYQGDEIWNLGLVDPDNRRPVDWDTVEAVVARVSDDAVAAEDTLARADDGDPKALLLVRALAVRRRWPEAFGPTGRYGPLTTAGGDRERLLAFHRGGSVVVAVPRFPERGDIEAEAELPAGRWHDALNPDVDVVEGRVAADRLFERFPVALLERHD